MLTIHMRRLGGLGRTESRLSRLMTGVEAKWVRMLVNHKEHADRDLGPTGLIEDAPLRVEAIKRCYEVRAQAGGRAWWASSPDKSPQWSLR